MGKLPLRFVPIGQLLGDHEGLETLSIPSVLSPGGSKDIWIDKEARLTSILGYSKQNAAAVTTNADAQPTKLRAIYHYIKPGPAAVDSTGLPAPTIGVRQEIGIFDSGLSGSKMEWRHSVDLGVTWIFDAQFTGADYADHIPSFTQMGSILLAAFGSGPIKVWDGVTLTSATSVQIQAPNIVAAGTGTLLGNYRWKVVPRRADGTRTAGSFWSNRVTLTNNKATVTWDADASASLYEVYRTTGTGEVAFFSGSVPAGVLSYTDDVPDLRIIGNRMLQEYGDSPPNGARAIFTHKERVFYLNVPGAPRRGYYSDPGLYASVNFGSSFFDFTDTNDADFVDEAVGGYGNYKGMGVVFCEHSIWTINGTGVPSGVLIDFARRRSNAQTGAVSDRVVVRVPQSAHYFEHDGSLVELSESVLAYITPLGELRAFNGSDDKVISHAKADTFRRLNYAARGKSFAFADTRHSELIFVFPADESDEPNVAVAWNYVYGTMVTREWPFAHATEIESSESASLILAGEARSATGGFCYKLWNGFTSPDGASVNAQIMTKSLYGVGGILRNDGMSNLQLLQYAKRWRWVELLLKSDDATMQFLVEWWPGEAKATDPPYGSHTLTWPVTSQLRDADGNLLEDAGGNPLVAVTTTEAPLRVRLHKTSTDILVKKRYLHSRGIRVRVSSSSTTGSWSLCGMLFAYQLLGGLKRDFRR